MDFRASIYISFLYVISVRYVMIDSVIG